MKVALISGTPAFPPTEGNRARIRSLALAIRSLGHEIVFVYLPAWSLTDVDEAAHRRAFGAQNFVRLAPELVSGRAPFLFRLRRKFYRHRRDERAFHNHLDEFFHPAWIDGLRALHARHGFDCAVVEYAMHAKALTAFPPSVLKILDTHDRFADRHRAYAQSANRYGYWFSVPPEREVVAFRRADRVLAIQEEEARDFAARLAGGPPAVTTLSHLLDVTDTISGDTSGRALFLGSANDANRDAIGWFTADILPFVLQRRPDFRLVLAGAICDAVADHPALEKIGRVETGRDAFRTAPVAINPMRIGTGIAIKLLDAMAAGMASISTETGARGLPPAFRQGLEVVPDYEPSRFAEALLQLCEDTGRRRRLGAAAHRSAIEWNVAQMAALQAVLLPKDGSPP